jgi:hypothetical protein
LALLPCKNTGKYALHHVDPALSRSDDNTACISSPPQSLPLLSRLNLSP